MITSEKSIKLSGYDAIELISNAEDNDNAVREMDAWCRRHNCTRSGERQLVQIQNGTVVQYTGLAYPAESTVELGKNIYRKSIASNLLDSDDGKILAIDVDSGDYEIAGDELVALDKIERRHENPRVYLMRVGYTALAGVGAAVPRDARQ